MAQLSDDCFAFSGPLMPLADMEKLIAERVQPVAETEVVSLNDARGRVIAPGDGAHAASPSQRRALPRSTASRSGSVSSGLSRTTCPAGRSPRG